VEGIQMSLTFSNIHLQVLNHLQLHGVLDVCERFYLIECLKRSDDKQKVWWNPARAGYTNDKDLAGRYTLEGLEECAGRFGDWVAHPHWIECKARQRGEFQCGD
jgi:hypothetical protein